ncbi:type II secretion system protein [Hippea sp. KM1]|uniref:type II secretion system protein n=1 Tax=Hippea sp. KM1 TaxID=944481 RepID=UPI00046D4EE2|nr:type II secretion system protein [Hippea sp. KM1]
MIKNKEGFTLIEIILAIVVFSIGVVGVMVVFYNTLGRTSDPIIRHRAVEVAQSVMDEILSRKFDNDTPNGGGVIPPNKINIGKESNDGSGTETFDDVDDFNGLSCTTGSNGCFPDVTPGYHVEVTVQCVKLNGNSVEVASCPENFKLITVKVKSKGLNETYTLKALKGNF